MSNFFEGILVFLDFFEGRNTKSQRNFLIGLFIGVSLFGAVVFFTFPSKKKSTEKEMSRLMKLVQNDCKKGNCPLSVEEIGNKRPKRKVRITDAWGTQFNLEIGQYILIRSAGADKLFDSKDDLVLIKPR